VVEDANPEHFPAYIENPCKRGYIQGCFEFLFEHGKRHQELARERIRLLLEYLFGPVMVPFIRRVVYGEYRPVIACLVVHDPVSELMRGGEPFTVDMMVLVHGYV
jgi:hypothetical protein